MKLKPMLALLAGVGFAPFASADTFNLSLTADAGSRWYDHYSAVYAELGSDWGVINNPSSGNNGESADGFYLISTGAKIGSGAVVFPEGGNFLNIGALSFDAASGAITGLTLDFDNFVADNDAITGTGYSTTVSNVSGTVTLAGGNVAAIDLMSDISFNYSTQFGVFSYAGSFAVNSDRFALDVDSAKATPFGSIRYVWDVDGGVQNLSPVPETSTFAMFFAGLALVSVMARRRNRSA